MLERLGLYSEAVTALRTHQETLNSSTAN
jgi:hypothetical protein